MTSVTSSWDRLASRPMPIRAVINHTIMMPMPKIITVTKTMPMTMAMTMTIRESARMTAMVSVVALTHRSPASFMRKHSILKSKPSTRERHRAIQWDVICSPVPDRTVHHSVGAKRHYRPDDSARNAVIPIMVFVNCEGTCDERRAEDRSVCSDELPHRGVVV